MVFSEKNIDNHSFRFLALKKTSNKYTASVHHPPSLFFFFFCQAQSEAHGSPLAMAVRKIIHFDY